MDTIIRGIQSEIRHLAGVYTNAGYENVTLHLELSGKRAITYFRFQGTRAEQSYTHFEDKPRFDEVEALANRYLTDYIAGKIDRVEVCYMKFLNADDKQWMLSKTPERVWKFPA